MDIQTAARIVRDARAAEEALTTSPYLQLTPRSEAQARADVAELEAMARKSSTPTFAQCKRLGEEASKANLAFHQTESGSAEEDEAIEASSRAKEVFMAACKIYFAETTS